MASRIRYMGNKRALAPVVAQLVQDLRPGRPLLDLFSGMCFVAGALAESERTVWVNDAQRYAELAARCLIASPAGPPEPGCLSDLILDFERNRQALRSRFARALNTEDRALGDADVEGYQRGYRAWRHAANSATVANEIAAARDGDDWPYRLCTLTFAWGYFGLGQAIDLDSVRYAIGRAYLRRRFSAEGTRWLRLALVQTASRIATGPGHLSQYLKGDNEASLARIGALRRRDVLAQFATELSLLRPFGSDVWRQRNAVYCGDALKIWPKLRAKGFRDALVYADPPYSKNQYSRFYHVLETVARYDYPSAHGTGRYRPDRFRTEFCKRAEVASAFERLAKGVAATGSDLILSYPADGLLQAKTGAGPEATLQRHFADVAVVWQAQASHSTLGARHGHPVSAAEELVYLAANPYRTQRPTPGSRHQTQVRQARPTCPADKKESCS